MKLADLVTAPEHAGQFRSTGQWNADTLSARLLHHARERGNATAVVDRGGARRKTYAELGQDASRVGRMLRDLDVAPGDVVSIQLPNCYEAVVAAVAAQSIGAVINPLLPNYRAHELRHVFRTARPKAIFSPAVYRGWDFRPMLDEVRATSGVPAVHVVLGAEGGGEVSMDQTLERPVEPSSIPGPVSAAAVSELIFTSGTEATPKAIMHTEETANFAVRVAFSDLGVSRDQTVWMPSPVGHSTGFNYGIRAALVHGSTLVLTDVWDASDALATILRDGCTFTLAATTFLRDLVEECERTGTRVPEFTHFGCGGAPVPAELVERADAVGICTLRLYGSTEVLCATWNRRESPLAKRLTTDGCALSNTDLELRDDQGTRIATPGEGELYVRGPNASVGFFADEERTAATYLADGWVRSGDLVRIDGDGYLTVVGRNKEIIIRGGVNIAPREVEELIAGFPEVVSAAVVGIPDPRLGERSCACVVIRPGQSLELSTMVSRLTAAGLATYKLPEELEPVDALPMTASGKVQKHEIVRRVLGARKQMSDGEIHSGHA
jgi:acyl-coenzyme A synthetase/AMP-(fatty) acid ligase